MRNLIVTKATLTKRLKHFGILQWVVLSAYVDLYFSKNPPRTSILSGMGWLKETWNTPGECHRQLRISTEIFFDLYDLLVERYGLKPSLHMSTHEMLGIYA
jgi:hypothetical protein